MIEVTTVLPRTYLEGKPLENGRAIFEEGEIDEHTLEMLRKNPKFTVRELGELLEAQMPESLSVEDAISQAMHILTPACQDYGVDPSALAKDIRVAFSEAEEVGKLEDADGGEEFQAVLDACVSLEAENPRDESKFAGDKPKTKILSDMVGFRVSGQVRDQAWKFATGEE